MDVFDPSDLYEVHLLVYLFIFFFCRAFFYVALAHPNSSRIWSERGRLAM